MKRIILCADDFGQSGAVSSGILQLVEAGRLSAVGCMSEAPGWRERGVELARHRGSIDIGLHFNLTHTFANQTLPARSLRVVLAAALSGRIDTGRLATALHAQLDRFEAAIGDAPDFVDGHQHVHIFPGIRTTLLRELSRRYPSRKPYLRNVNPRWRRTAALGDTLKSSFLKLMNSGFSDAAKNFGLPCTGGFGGIYSLHPDADYAALMQDWLAAARDGDLLMCHPGAATNDAADPIAATRPHELQYLNSDRFAALLQSADVRLCRFQTLV